MNLGIIATKIGITQLYTDDYKCIPVTVLKINNCIILDIFKKKNSNFNYVKVGFNLLDKNKNIKLNKPLSGYFLNNNISFYKKIIDFKINSNIDNYIKNQILDLTLFNKFKTVKITSYSKGKGFSGVMKLHNFSGFPGSHGTHEYFRHGGSIGCRAKPGRVFKGKKMPSRMGGKKITLTNLSIYSLDFKNNLLIIRGSIPGSIKSLVKIVPFK